MKKSTVSIAVVLSLLVGGTALAATNRDITTRLGGQVGDVFRVFGQLMVNSLRVTGDLRVGGSIFRGPKKGPAELRPVIVDDNLQVKGALTVKGLPVAGTKRYTGKIDTGARGDYVADFPYTTNCTLVPAGIIGTHTHWKAISVPEVAVSALVNVRVFMKPTQPSGYTNGYYPNGGDVWTSWGYSASNGQIWVIYKTVTESCNGTLTETPGTSGDYAVIVE